jgi:hypothetical protein
LPTAGAHPRIRYNAVSDSIGVEEIALKQGSGLDEQ